MGSWEWDSLLYEGSAPYYRRGRLPYSPRLARSVADALELDGRGRLIDIGTGPGIVALELSPYFEEVVGIDADVAMVGEAERESRERGISNVTWRNLRGEELPAGLGSFRVATFAQSFHWMKRELVAPIVRDMLDPGRGRLVLVNASTVHGLEHAHALEHPSPPSEAITELIERYLGTVRRAGRGTLPNGTPWDEEQVLEEVGFSGPQVVFIPDDRVITRTTDDVVASVFALSRSAPHLFGDRLGRFEVELRSLLTDASPSGLFSEKTGENQLRIFSVR